MKLSFSMRWDTLFESHGDETRSMSASDIADTLSREKNRHDKLRQAIPELVRQKPGQPISASMLGYLFRKLKGKVREGKRLCIIPKSGGKRRFYVEDTKGENPGVEGGFRWCR